MYDIDSDGIIQFSDILEIVQAARAPIHKTELETVFAMMDADNDDMLSFEEFSRQSLDDFTLLRILSKQIGVVRFTPNLSGRMRKVIVNAVSCSNSYKTNN